MRVTHPQMLGITVVLMLLIQGSLATWWCYARSRDLNKCPRSAHYITTGYCCAQTGARVQSDEGSVGVDTSSEKNRTPDGFNSGVCCYFNQSEAKQKCPKNYNWSFTDYCCSTDPPNVPTPRPCV